MSWRSVGGGQLTRGQFRGQFAAVSCRVPRINMQLNAKNTNDKSVAIILLVNKPLLNDTTKQSHSSLGSIKHTNFKSINDKAKTEIITIIYL